MGLVLRSSMSSSSYSKICQGYTPLIWPFAYSSLMNKEGFSCWAKFHEEVGLKSIDIDSDLLDFCEWFFYMFVAGSEDLELAEADVKRWADKGAVRVPHNYDIDAAAQCGLFNERILRSVVSLRSWQRICQRKSWAF